MNDNGFSSMDELIDLLTRGGEIEFIFHSRQYSLLPNHWNEEPHWVDIVQANRNWGNAMMGENCGFGWVWRDLEFYEVSDFTTIDGYKLKDIIHRIEVTFRPDK